MEGAAMVSRKWRCHSNRGVRSVKESDQGHWATRGGFSLVCRLRLPWRRYTWKPRPSLCDHSPRSAASPLSNWILHNRSRIIQFFLLPESQNNPAESQTFSNYIFTEKKKEFSTHSLCLKRKICTIKKRKSHFPHFGKIFFLPNRAILHQFEDLNWLRESEMLSNRHPHISERTISGKICFLISLTLNQQKHLFRFLSYSIQSFESLSEMAFESSTIIIYLKRKIINWQFLTNHN